MSPSPASARRLALCALAATLVLPAAAEAQVGTPGDAPSAADQALQRLKESLQNEPNLSPETKAAMAAFFEALAARQAAWDDLDAAALQRLVLQDPATPGRWEKLKEQLTLSGDIRLREEYSTKLDDQTSRDRTRYRLRLGADYEIDDAWSVGARLRTGDPDDPNSPHSTLGDVFNSDSFELDRAFIAYRAASLEGLRLVGGKFGHPFYANPVYGELVWDADVNPEGIAATYTIPGDEKSEKLDFALGKYLVLEQGGGSEVNMHVAQIAGTQPLSEKTTGTLALGYYHYGQLTPDGSQSLVTENPSQTGGGNALVDTNGDGTADEFASDFEIWNPVAALSYQGWSRPVTFSAEYIKNSQASGSLDSGRALGVSVGQQKVAGDWQYYYQWQKVEQDAVFAAFAQDDFLLASNQTGHVFGTRYRIKDNIGAHLWALVSSRDSAGTTSTTNSRQDQWRLRLDLDVRF